MRSSDWHMVLFFNELLGTLFARVEIFNPKDHGNDFDGALRRTHPPGDFTKMNWYDVPGLGVLDMVFRLVGTST